MGIGPSTKETSLHHFRDPLLDVVSEDTERHLTKQIMMRTVQVLSHGCTHFHLQNHGS